MPLEDEIAAAAKKHFPIYQAAFGPLAVELRNLGLPTETSDRAESLVGDLTEVVSGDGSDAVKRFGGPESALHQDLLWARNLKKALDNGLRQRLAHIRRLRRDIEGLPDSGIPGKLRAKATPTLIDITDILGRTSFYEEGAALAQHAGTLDKLIADTVGELAAQQQQIRTETLERWEKSVDWEDLDAEQREWFTAELAKLSKKVPLDADGLRDLLNHDFDLNHQLRDLAKQLGENAMSRRAEREKASKQKEEEEEEEEKPKEEIETKQLFLTPNLQTEQEIENLIRQLSEFLTTIKAGTQLRISCRILDDRTSKGGTTYL
jgi:hypothetical protein